MTIARRALEAIERHALDDAPLECCGLLVGSPGHVQEAIRSRNALASRTRFLVHPEDHFSAIRSARLSGAMVVGAYHSHPETSPSPSQTDVADSEGDPQLMWVIVSLQHGPGAIEVRAYRPREGYFDPIDLVIVD